MTLFMPLLVVVLLVWVESGLWEEELGDDSWWRTWLEKLRCEDEGIWSWSWSWLEALLEVRRRGLMSMGWWCITCCGWLCPWWWWWRDEVLDGDWSINGCCVMTWELDWRSERWDRAMASSCCKLATWRWRSEGGDAAVDGVLDARLRLEDQRSHGVPPLSWRQLQQELAHVARPEDLVHVRKLLRVVGREVWCEHAFGRAFPAQELASRARRRGWWRREIVEWCSGHVALNSLLCRDF